MALVTGTFTLSDPLPCDVGERVRWNVVGITGLTTIVTTIMSWNASTNEVVLEYDDAVLPAGVEELNACHLECPECIGDTCCDIYFHEAASTADLSAVPATLNIGDNYMWIGGSLESPDSLYRYKGIGDPQVLTNWVRVESPTSASVTQQVGGVIVAEGTIPTPATPLHFFRAPQDITFVGFYTSTFAAAPLYATSTDLLVNGVSVILTPSIIPAASLTSHGAASPAFNPATLPGGLISKDDVVTITPAFTPDPYAGDIDGLEAWLLFTS